MQTRIIGQDNELSIQIDQQVVSTLAIVSSELTFMMVTKETGMLGETFDRVDEVFKGLSGTIEFQSGDPEALRCIQIITDRAMRRAAPRPRVTLKSQFTYPDSGVRALIVVPDLKFGDIPINTQSREDHVQFRYQWRAEIASVVFIG